MVSALTVVPSIVPEWTEACLQTWKGEATRLLVVDNTVENLGVAASWNMGARRVVDEGADYVILLSAAVRFGPPGGQDFLEALEEQRPLWGLEADNDLGWHLVAFSRRLFELVGYFDENFWPAYHEDNDFSYRVQVATNTRGGGAWVKTPVRASLQGKAHGVLYGGAKPDFEALEAYFSRKWGGPSGCESYLYPFGDPRHPIDWCPGPGDEELRRCELRPGERLICPHCREPLIEATGESHGPLPLDYVMICCGRQVRVKHMLKLGGPC